MLLSYLVYLHLNVHIKLAVLLVRGLLIRDGGRRFLSGSNIHSRGVFICMLLVFFVVANFMFMLLLICLIFSSFNKGWPRCMVASANKVRWVPLVDSLCSIINVFCNNFGFYIGCLRRGKLQFYSLLEATFNSRLKRKAPPIKSLWWRSSRMNWLT